MEHNIQLFEHEEFGSVRVVMIDGEPWFVGKDVAIALGYANTNDALAKHVTDKHKRGSQITTPYGVQNFVVIIDGDPWFVAADVCRILELGNPSQAVSRLDDDEKRKITESRVVVDPHLNIGSDSREINVVNEPGLYRLIFSSRKPEAKNFQRWVYHEVLPSIRKTGAYNLPNADGFNMLAQAILELVAVEREKLAFEREKFVAANSEETKLFKRAQLLRDIASSSRDDVLRDKLIREATNILMGDDFFKKIPGEDNEGIAYN